MTRRAVVGVVVVVAWPASSARAQPSGVVECPGRVNLIYGAAESTTRAWAVRMWLERLVSEVPKADATALPADIADEAIVTICVRRPTTKGPATQGLGPSGADADAEVVISTPDGLARPVVRFRTSFASLVVPPSMVAAGLTPDPAFLGLPASLVQRMGRDAPKAWSSVVGRQWTVSGGAAAIAITLGNSGQPGLDRRDHFVWIDDCGALTGTIDFHEDVVWTSTAGQVANCASAAALRKSLDGANTVAVAKSGASWTLRGAGGLMKFVPTTSYPSGTWRVVRWEQKGAAARVGVGDVQFGRGRVTFSDGCNRREDTYVVGRRYLAIQRGRTTAKYCQPDSFVVSDLVEIERSGTVAYRRLNATTMEIDTAGATATLHRLGP